MTDRERGAFDRFFDSRTCMSNYYSSRLYCCHVYSWNKPRPDHLETHGTPLREPVERYNHDCVVFLAPVLPLLRMGTVGSFTILISLYYAGGTEFVVTPSMMSL
jgi:hypothetical protein